MTRGRAAAWVAKPQQDSGNPAGGRNGDRNRHADQAGLHEKSLDRSVMVVECEQTPALGAAIYPALAAGLFHSFEEATKVLGSPYIAEYKPDPSQTAIMAKLMQRYTDLGISIERLTHLNRS